MQNYTSKTTIIDYSLHGIENELKQECITNGFTDNLKDLSSSEFYYILCQTGIRLFKNTDYLKEHNSKHYNTDRVLDIFNIYIQLSIKYNKKIDSYNFTDFIGYTRNGAYLNVHNACGLNSIMPYIEKTCNDMDNRRVQDGATDSKIPVLNLAYNNYRHNWNGQIKENAIKASVKSLDDIRKQRLELSANDGQNDNLDN